MQLQFFFAGINSAQIFCGRVCGEGYLVTGCVSNLHREQTIWFLRHAYGIPQASHHHPLMLFLVFFFFSPWLALAHQRQYSTGNNLQWSHVCERDGSSSFFLTHHVSQKICASPHDALCKRIPCCDVRKHLLPNLLHRFLRPCWQIIVLQVTLLAHFSRDLEAVPWNVTDHLCTSNVPSSLYLGISCAASLTSSISEPLSLSTSSSFFCFNSFKDPCKGPSIFSVLLSRSNQLRRAALPSSPCAAES